MRIPILILIYFLFALSGSAQTKFSHQVFQSNIKTAYIVNEFNPSTFPLLQLGTDQQLSLHFDDLSDVTKNFTYTYIHCNADWTQSNLFDNDYIDGYLEQSISNYTFSVNTSVKYIHYTLNFPSPEMNITKSGNYIMYVYEEFDKERPVATIPFYVTENKVEIKPQPKTPVAFDQKYTHHEIDFTVNTSLTPSNNPFQEYEAVITQNDRLETAIHHSSPKFINANLLIYDFEKENQFPAGKEYRVFDIRDIQQLGVGVQKIVFQDSAYAALLNFDENRAYKSYFNSFDNNGDFFINAGTRRSAQWEGDYVWTYFTLKSKSEMTDGLVYINGKAFQAPLSSDYKMQYNDSMAFYTKAVLLKQGVYNYQYTFLKDGESVASNETFEGANYQTQNLYTIFMYHKRFEDNYQRLIGVKRFYFQ